MIHAKKTLLIVLLVALLAVTWLMVVSGGPRLQAKQNDLIARAEAYLADEIYVTALPLLREAVEMNTERSVGVRQKLIDCYLKLGDKQAATGQLEILAAGRIADESVYLQLAEMYFAASKYKLGISTLQQGMSIVDSPALTEAYDLNRFRHLAYSTGYDSIGGNYGGALMATLSGKQGYLRGDNSVAIGFKFDKVTDFDKGNAFVIDNGKAVVINGAGQRLALCKEAVEDIAPLGNGIGAVKIGGIWYYTDSSFNRDGTPYEYIGRLSGGYRAVKQDGSWYLHDESRKAVTPALAEIKLDSDGNAVGQGRIFVRQGDSYILTDTAGAQIGSESYEDAYPFIDGAAAVKQDGKWRFINPDGAAALEATFDMAKSFSCGLAPVQVDGKWGYVDGRGIMRVAAEFDDVNPLRSGSAAVNKADRWLLVQLKAYK